MSGLSAQLHFVAGAGIEGSFDLQVDLALPQSGVTAVFGESGSGKTTLLRCLAGLERGATGRVSFGDTVWQDAAVFVPTHLRRIGYVFQESSQLSHLTVLANLRYGARRARMEGDTGFEPVVELMGIVSLLQKYPAQLSGGERQRVAIARSLLQRPRLLLMDEPLAALDAARKQEILPYLEELPRQFDLPIVYVTHSLDEVARLAQRLVVLREGRVVADGALTEVMSDLSLPMQLGEQAG